MTTFSIDTDNSIVACATPDEIAQLDSNATSFNSPAMLAKVSADWGGRRVVIIEALQMHRAMRLEFVDGVHVTRRDSQPLRIQD